MSKDKTVHCHVGSLENSGNIVGSWEVVHCHVGSLENKEMKREL
ncbi:hypothetical protein SAMN05421643_102148 [Acinetobacter kyonggiensis]|uniref:Uncharacterized protein n=1 Tax=Acinetobacter kyonggiensis TaxID=595670 RepID=A0A1H3GFR7_9GAMM|nr:hypothetical protein SAMN05421643_102148 [Acinetobacter kyonggiensis]